MQNNLLGLAVMFSLLSAAVSAQNEIWMSRAEAVQCDMTSVQWAQVRDHANLNITPDIHNMDDDSDAYTLAAGLVYLRLPNIMPYPPIPGAQTRPFYRAKVVSICSIVASQGVPSDVDARVRNPLGYILAADMIDLGQADPIVDASFRSWILSWLPQGADHAQQPAQQSGPIRRGHAHRCRHLSQQRP